MGQLQTKFSVHILVITKNDSTAFHFYLFKKVVQGFTYMYLDKFDAW